MGIHLSVEADTLLLYRFEEAANVTTPADSGSGGYTLTAAGTGLTLSVQGISGRARSFGQVAAQAYFTHNAYVAALRSAHDPAHSLTYEAVVYPRGTNASGLGPTIAGYGHTTPGSLAFLYWKTNGAVGWGHQYSNGTQNVLVESSASTLSFNAWHYVVGVREWTGSQYNMRVYVDGSQVASQNNVTAPQASAPETSSRMTVGSFPSQPTFTMNGDLDQLRVSTTAKTAGYIQALSPMLLLSPYTLPPLLGGKFHRGWV